MVKGDDPDNEPNDGILIGGRRSTLICFKGCGDE